VLAKAPLGVEQEGVDGVGAQRRRRQGVDERLRGEVREDRFDEPGDVGMRLQIARLLIERPDAAWFAPDKAVLLAREAERLKPDGDPLISIVLAEALMAAGKDQEALQQIERAYTRFPTSTEVQTARDRLRAAKSTKPKKG
jgi:predicted Zn-dependent protease